MLKEIFENYLEIILWDKFALSHVANISGIMIPSYLGTNRYILVFRLFSGAPFFFPRNIILAALEGQEKKIQVCCTKKVRKA